MAGLSTIQHKGIEILYLDYQGLNEAQMIAVLRQAEATVMAEDKAWYLLTNINNAFATPEFMSASNQVGKRVAHRIQRAAIVGVTGAKRLLLKGYNLIFESKLQPFETVEQALAYLSEPSK